jgi:argininosuccinate synthase
MDKIILAFAGGLDTSVAVRWLAETYQAEIIAVTVDLGQGRELESIRERALACGCVRAHVMDVRAEFADRFILPALQAGALYEGAYPMATALGRPLIANKLIEIARIEGATAIAHGSTGKGNDQIRFDACARALAPNIRVIAPVRTWSMSRAEKLAFAGARGVPVPPPQASAYSVDTNLWGRSVACGALEDAWAEPPADSYALTADPRVCPDEPAYVEISFERGVPTAVNGVPMPLTDLIGSLTTIAGSHGVGRIDIVENRVVGFKSREVYEAPAAIVLHQAHRELESFVSPRDLDRVKQDLSQAYADLVYNGLWYSPLREAIDAFVANVQTRVTGTIRLRLFKGHATVVGRTSPVALYDRTLATYGDDDRFDHRASEGFVKIWGLSAETAAAQLRNAAKPAGTVTS